MAVAFDANATLDATANGVTSITTSNLTIGSGASRALLVQAVWSGAVTSPSMNWDQLGTPQALAQVPSATATNTRVVQIWGMVNPTSGAKQLKAAWTTARDVIVNPISYTNVDQTGGATSFPHGAGATGTSAAGAVTVTSAAGNAVIGVYGTDVVISSVDHTQTFLDNNPNNCSGAGNWAVGAASVTLNASFGSSFAWAAAGCDILAAAAVTFLAAPNKPIGQAVSRATNW